MVVAVVCSWLCILFCLPAHKKTIIAERSELLQIIFPFCFLYSVFLSRVFSSLINCRLNSMHLNYKILTRMRISKNKKEKAKRTINVAGRLTDAAYLKRELWSLMKLWWPCTKMIYKFVNEEDKEKRKEGQGSQLNKQLCSRLHSLGQKGFVPIYICKSICMCIHKRRECSLRSIISTPSLFIYILACFFCKKSFVV